MMKPHLTLKEDLERYRPVLILDSFISRKNLSRLRTIFFSVTLLSAAAYLAVPFLNTDISTDLFFGIGLISFGLWLEQILLYSYHNRFYFYGLNSILSIESKPALGATYEIALALHTHQEDVTAGFCRFSLGQSILFRSGVPSAAIEMYLASPRSLVVSQEIILTQPGVFSLISLGTYLLKGDPSFAKFIKEQGVTTDTFLGALSWVVLAHHQDKKQTRWWGRDNLSKTKGLGTEWSYGTPFLLEKYTAELSRNTIFKNTTLIQNVFPPEKISAIEVTLAGSHAANILLLGEAGMGIMDLVAEIADRQKNGKALGAITTQRMLLLDTGRLFASVSDKAVLEVTLLNLFTEAHNAGNITIVIENISSVIKDAESRGIFLPQLLDEFLASPQLHIIATDSPGAYHASLERLQSFKRRFTEVLLEAPSLRTTVHILESLALSLEQRFGTLFTWSALQAVASGADRYLVEGAMPEKAILLLEEVNARAVSIRTGLITSNFVYTIITEKTGIPVGEVTAEERDVLLNLESKLHERVIGQDEALLAVARTMRRARAGIQSAEKPIGSFLFLGPTGVGKTETAKALAFVFFGSEEKMHRLDMSEFAGPDALGKLLGKESIPGLLPTMLREYPYAVLLLDEFEKASRAVHDIFLQILDEGIFSDSNGESVNARNTIIIATSNAGSDLIIKTVAERRALSTLNSEIIQHLITTGAYRPELINRFDSTIIFEPLTRTEQGEVAKLLLRGLSERIAERGYTLTLSKDLLDLLVDKGYSPEFGARPMQRVLQDVIEEKIAELILNQVIKPGDTITLSRENFANHILETK